MMSRPAQLSFLVAAVGLAMPAAADTIYLAAPAISVEVGPRTAEGSFNNTFAWDQTIEKAIDAPSADAEELHTQLTHIWFSSNVDGGGLELLFDFGQRYDITTLHFWNYSGEGYDVDRIDFEFFDSTDVSVGQITIEPDLGTSPGIRAQDIELAAPLGVQRVSAMLVGSNRQIDFQNIGFTAVPSAPLLVIPPLQGVEPPTDDNALHISDGQVHDPLEDGPALHLTD